MEYAQAALAALNVRVLCLIEFVVRRALAAAGPSLPGLYAGQLSRATARPTSEALLSAFKEINLVLIRGPERVERHLTPLTALQEWILTLLGLPDDTYAKLRGVFRILHTRATAAEPSHRRGCDYRVRQKVTLGERL